MATKATAKPSSKKTSSKKGIEKKSQNGKTVDVMTDEQPGLESEMDIKPRFDYVLDGAGKRLEGKNAVITGGDSGIGRAVAVAYAAEGANVLILFKYGAEEDDAKDTQRYIKRKYKTDCELIGFNVADYESCKAAAKKILELYSKVDILINNAAVHFPADELEEITAEQIELTFRTNVYGMFYLTQLLLPKMKSGSCIINTASVTAFRGSHHLLDYASTKGAVVAFTRSLASNLADKGIRVNGVAPGPVLTPLIQASFGKAHLKKFGKDTALGRAAHPNEIAPSYVFLASAESSYITGQFIHPNGGEIINT